MYVSRFAHFIVATSLATFAHAQGPPSNAAGQPPVIRHVEDPFAVGLESPIAALPLAGDRARIVMVADAPQRIAFVDTGLDGRLETGQWIEEFPSGVAVAAAAAGPQLGVHVLLAIDSGTQVAGLAEPSLGGEDIGLVRYDALGDRLGVTRIGTAHDDKPRAAIAAPDGGLFVVGETAMPSTGIGNGTRTRAFVTRRSADGQHVWTRLFPSPFQGGVPDHFQPQCAAFDETTGQLHVGGSAWNATPQNRTSARVSFDVAGNPGALITGEIGRGAITAIASAAGTVYVAGDDDLARSGALLCTGANAWRVDIAAPAAPWGRGRACGLVLTGAGPGAPNAAPASLSVLASTSSHTTPTLRSSLVVAEVSLDGQLVARWDEVTSDTFASFPRAVVALPSGAALALASSRVPDDASDSSVTLLRVDTHAEGATICAGEQNSSGATATLTASGFDALQDDALLLSVSGVPAGEFGLFLCSRVGGLNAAPAGAPIALCLGGDIGRFNGPGQVWQAAASGCAALVLDLASLPTPNRYVPALTGERWHFQAWYRDSAAQTSRFSSSVAIDFR